MPNIPFVCSLRFKKHFVFIFNELIALFVVPFAESMCVCVSAVEYKNEEEASITEVFYGSFCFIDFNRANDKRKRFRFLPKAIAEIYLYLNINYVFCERAQWGSNKLHNERTCYARLLIYCFWQCKCVA